jgi:methylthioribose-1-phosphate isomerase
VVNKVGTWLKAVAARQAGVPFWVAAPSSSIDWEADDGRLVPIEQRPPDEVAWVEGAGPDGRASAVRPGPAESDVANPAFDLTPAALVTGLITERGTCPASEEGLLSLFPERGR